MFTGHKWYVVLSCKLRFTSLLVLCGIEFSLKLAKTGSVHVYLVVVGCFQSYGMHGRAYLDVIYCISQSLSMIISVIVITTKANADAANGQAKTLMELRP